MTGPGDDRVLGLDEAYAVDGPDDNRRLYASWAKSYETEFIDRMSYVYHRRVAEIFCEALTDPAGAVLDVGCGTGAVGRELTRLGITVIDGIDISPEMLAEARSLSVPAGPVYRELIEADLTEPIAVESNGYAGIVSAGTFTHGHLGPDALSELFRVAAPGARCAIGINSAHFDDLGFRDALERHRDARTIGPYRLTPAPIYDNSSEDDPDAVAYVVELTVA